jgi:GxxExxY protein
MVEELGDEEFKGLHHLLTERIIRVFYQVYNELGFGFVESVYKEAMQLALMDAGICVESEVNLRVHFRGRLIGVFRADLVVDEQVILELKIADRITKTHETQLLHYLRSTAIEVGLVLNFGESPTVKRVIMTNGRKRLAVHTQKP